MALDMKALARLGAQARLAELVAEMDALLKEFPGLAKTKASEETRPENAPQKTRKRRKKMTAAQRKAASARMKAYWENRKKK